MEKIKDERLKLKNLENIRIAFIIQTFGIVAILVFDFVSKGMEEMTGNPLWIVFLITMVAFSYLSMNISIEYEKPRKSPKKSLGIWLSVLVFLSILIGFLSTIGEQYTAATGVMVGGIIFICGLIPALYIYYLRKKNREE
ncbi:hypothetical protein [Oceanobacillus luteolus]|uniref:Branched-chain amino acid ABC transporter substrate-binding protein n=1 Tax=Oceanobacillus luteolus TaxID=1274358 RepID=A0ABW4HWY3_9BACI